MKTVKTWKAERNENTTNWIANVVIPTIERLSNKGKERVVFTNVSNSINYEIVKEMLKDRCKVSVVNNELHLNWKDEISVETVIKTLG